MIFGSLQSFVKDLHSLSKVFHTSKLLQGIMRL